MKPVLVVVVLGLLAGCAVPPGAPGPDRPALSGWQLDCTLGAHEARNATWVQPCLARASHTVGPKQEIWLAVNPTDPRNVVLGAKDNNPASSQQCTWNGVFVTKDGGASWTDVVIGGNYLERMPGEPWYGYACNTDPMFRFSAGGDLHYAVELYNVAGSDPQGPLGPSPNTGRPYILPGWRLLLATSHDGGLTWPDVVVLLDGDGLVALNDYSRMAVTPRGTVLEAIGFLSGSDFLVPGLGLPEPAGSTGAEATTHSYCWVTGSEDGGKTAFAPRPVVQNPPKGVACQGIAAAPDGTVVLGGEPGGTAVGGELGSGHYRFAISTDDGRSFGDFGGGFDYTTVPGYFNNTRYRTGVNLELLYDAKGTLHAMHADYGRGNADIVMRTSPDHGATWSPPVRVNEGSDDHDQFMGNFAIAGDGSIHAFWMDRKYDAGNRLIGVTHGVSRDGGVTWQEEQVTSVAWDGELGVHQEGFPFIGDYIGADAVGDHVWGGFPDASNGATTVVAAAHVQRLP